MVFLQMLVLKFDIIVGLVFNFISRLLSLTFERSSRFQINEDREKVFNSFKWVIIRLNNIAAVEVLKDISVCILNLLVYDL